MPGIVGLITRKPADAAQRELLVMMGTLHHQCFYVTGTWCDPSIGVYAGWVAREGSFSDGMPLRNEDTTVVLLFSGEEYSGPEAGARLGHRGPYPRSDDASYLVHAYEENASFPAGLNGWFHGLVLDGTRQTATLFNDRFGMHRLYYHESKDAFYFAAEAKAILAARPELRTADNKGVGEFIALGCALENRTLFERIHVLPPASTWTFRRGAIDKKTTYFQPYEWEKQTPLEPEAYYEELRGVFSRTLPRYLTGKQGIGMSLTGGLDTRAVMAWQKSSPGTLPCYTFGGPYRECRDVRIARRVAAACGQPHHVIQAGADFLSAFPQYAERTVYLTDGCADVSCSPVLYGCQRAREIAPVRITGNYGDQILRRFRAFKPELPTGGIYSAEFQPYIDAALKTYQQTSTAHPLSFAAFRQAPWHHHGLLALEQSQLTLRSPFLDNDLVRVNFRAPKKALDNNAVRLRLIADGNPSLARIRTDMGFGGIGETFPGALVRVCQTFTFKAEYAYNHGMPQWLARVDHLLAPLHLERLFLGRHKYYHFRVWYRDRLAKYVREMSLDSRTLSRPYVSRKAVQNMVEHHLRGDGNYTKEIHRLLSLELIHRLFLDAR